jgi:hypothetical protein
VSLCRPLLHVRDWRGASVNYVEKVAKAIHDAVPKALVPDSDADLLFTLYALLCLTQGANVTAPHVHDAWSVWMAVRGEQHQSLVPYGELPPEVRAEDNPFVAAIRRVAEGAAPSMQPNPVVPPEISTGCLELDLVWKNYATKLLDRSQILIPDTDDDLTWHGFLGHSIDMQGFRAAEFAGVDPLTRPAPNFVPLKQRGIGVSELAALWDVPEIQQHMLTGPRVCPSLPRSMC